MATSCPLCCQSISVDLLRTNLIGILSRPLICPICADVQHGFDNLAAHLTRHIEPVPSQIHDDHTIQRDANIGIQNTINAAAGSATVCSESELAKLRGDQTSTRTFDVASPLSSSTPSSPPVSLQSLNIASEPADCVAARPIDQHSPTFACNLCDVTFRSIELQEMHMQLVHEINIRPSGVNPLAPNTMQQCCWCPKRFKTVGSLRLHVRMVHCASHVPHMICAPNAYDCGIMMSNNSLVPLSSPSSEAAVGRDDDDEKVLNETGDPSIAQSVDNLPLIHNNQPDCCSNYGVNDSTFDGSGNNNELSADDCGSGGMIDQKDVDQQANGNNNNSNEMAIASTDDRLHICDICKKRFTTKYFLKKHKRLHTGKLNEIMPSSFGVHFDFFCRMHFR